MVTFGRRKGVHRYGRAHGLRLTETMQTVVEQLARQQEQSISDTMRYLLDQAISQRDNAVQAQQDQLNRIEDRLIALGEMIARVEGGVGEVEMTVAAIQVVVDPATEEDDPPMVMGSDGLVREYYPGTGWS